jgi:hypothetical protein
MAERYKILRAIETPSPEEGGEPTTTFEDTGLVFEAKPAPEPTLGGYLLALLNETGVVHCAEPIPAG